MVTRYPGFKDPVHDAQQSFRALLDAMAHPGSPSPIIAEVEPPMGLMPATAAACLTLLDLDVNLWLQPGWHESVRSWLLFHTGCRFVDDGAIAHFALVHTWNTDTRFAHFHSGTPEAPEQSTTLFIQLADQQPGTPQHLRGPGIQTHQVIAPPLPPTFWDDWHKNHQMYPLGIDIFLFQGSHITGLPRTTATSPTHQ